MVIPSSSTVLVAGMGRSSAPEWMQNTATVRPGPQPLCMGDFCSIDKLMRLHSTDNTYSRQGINMVDSDVIKSLQEKIRCLHRLAKTKTSKNVEISHSSVEDKSKCMFQTAMKSILLNRTEMTFLGDGSVQTVFSMLAGMESVHNDDGLEEVRVAACFISSTTFNLLHFM